MRERLKKPIAIIMGVILMLTLIVTPMDVRAYTETGGTITLDYFEEVTVTDSTSNSYKVVNGSTLIIADGATVSGNIELEMGGTLTINAGCYVNSISTTDGGSISNLGTISGTVTLVYATLTNFGSGSITGEVSAGMNATVENSGTINKISANNATITNYNTGTITDIDVVFSTLNNKGTIGTCSIDELAGSCTIKLEATSKITNYISPLLLDDFSYKITASEGAEIAKAEIYVDSLDAYGGSTGTLTISNSLELSGTTNIPSGLTMAVGSDTQITSSGYSGWHVSYGGNSYLLPASTFTGKTISDLYKLTASENAIAFSDLEVGYGTADIAETAKTLTLSNTGMCDMRYKVAAIPDFVELYDGETALTVGSIIPLSSGGTKDLIIKVKADKAADEYSGDLSLEQWTDVEADDADDVLVSTDNIPITLNVNRLEGIGTVTVSDIQYGGTISPVAESSTNGNDAVTYKYKVKGEPDTTYTEAEPAAVGVYTVQATFAQTDTYKVVEATADFKITQADGVATLKVTDKKYGEEIVPEVESATNGTDAVTYKYKAQGAPDIAYVETVPTAVGDYTVQATFAETVNYYAVVKTADFSILRADGVATLTVENVKFGQEITPVVTSSTNGIDAVTYKYKVQGAADTTYTATVPTAVGDYTVQATFAQTASYEAVTKTADFSILRAEGSATLTVENVKFGQEITPVVTSSTNGIDAVTYKYKAQGAADTTYTEDKPTEVGDYTVQATFAQTASYEAVTKTADFSILRAEGTATVTVVDIRYGQSINPIPVSTTNGIGSVTYRYKQKDDPDTAYTVDEPTEAGEYMVQATFAETADYEAVVVTTTFKIMRAQGSGTVTVEDITYGETITPDVTSATNGTDAVTYKYKKKGAEDTAYTAAEPTEAGDYTIQATFAQTVNYEAVTATADFKIVRASGLATVTIADVAYGETITPVVTSSTNGIDAVTYKYKVKGAADTTYTTANPTEIGEYTVQATFAQTVNYEAVVATADFKIVRANGLATVMVTDVTYGEAITPVVTSATNGTDNVTYEYKVKGEADTTYTQTAPTKVGAYTVRATFAQTDIYNTVTATGDFEITYLKAPESPYSMSGKQGADGYYISDVIITPAEGYLIAETLDGNYREKLAVSESADTFNIYLKKIATGEKTAAIQVTVIRIDMDSPAILNAGSGEKIYGEQVEVIIKDDNLARVLVNGEAVEIENHMAILQLSSNLGEETYEITCIDVAGNTSKTTVVVAADWMKDRMIPEGSTVRLTTEYSYQLGGGTWRVQGDGTSYAGGSTFYVTSEGEYTFTKID